MNDNNDKKVIKFENRTYEFLKKNKKKILLIGELATVIIGIAIVIDDIHKTNNVKELYRRIEKLENSCKQKDDFFKKFISDGTKRGDSECARQLAYRRIYLKAIS